MTKAKEREGKKKGLEAQQFPLLTQLLSPNRLLPPPTVYDLVLIPSFGVKEVWHITFCRMVDTYCIWVRGGILKGGNGNKRRSVARIVSEN
jgi:hypothetical protein